MESALYWPSCERRYTTKRYRTSTASLNGSLSPNHEIRVISISLGWWDGAPGGQAAAAALERARRAGISVITTNLADTYGFRFHGLDRSPLSDPESTSSYSLVGWEDAPGTTTADSILCVPMTSRTTAAPNGPNDYAF